MKTMLIEQIAKVCYKYTYSLANALEQNYVDVTIAIDQKEEQENCTAKRINLFNTDEKNISKLSKLMNYIKSYRSIYREVRKGKYDILHTQWFIFSPIDYYYIRKIKKRCKVGLVTTVHDILPFNKKFYDLFFHKKLYGLADRIILQADSNRDRFGALFPVFLNKCEIIPHGHFLDYAEPVQTEIARQYLQIDRDKMVFLFFGQIKRVKGVGVLLNAFSQFIKDKKDVLLIIAGSVWKDDFSEYSNIIETNNLFSVVRTDIRYIPDDEVKYYFSAADCCVLPYTDVYQSGVVQLCYAYRKPVVASDIGAFKEVVNDGITGYICKVNNQDSLAEKMDFAYRNKANLCTMGHKGYEYIKSKYSWDSIAKSISQVYDRVSGENL